LLRFFHHHTHQLCAHIQQFAQCSLRLVASFLLLF
jgi:hypothetical protein